MRKYITLTIFSLGIAAYCWAATEATYRYPAEGTLSGPTLIILVGEDVSFEQAVELRRRNMELEEQLIAARAEIAELRGRMSRAVDDLNIVEGYLSVSGPDAVKIETPIQVPEWWHGGYSEDFNTCHVNPNYLGNPDCILNAAHFAPRSYINGSKEKN